MLTMIHPEIAVTAKVVDAAVFNAVWAPRGWELLGPAESFACESLGVSVKDVTSLKVKELRALISARGLEYPAAGVLKDELLETYRGTFPAPPPAEVEAVEAAIVAGVPVAVDPEPTDPGKPPAEPVVPDGSNSHKKKD